LPLPNVPRPPTIGLFRTLPGRLLILSALLRFALWLIERGTTLPLFLQIFRQVVSLSLIASAVWLIVLIVARARGRFLWRVRRKLILSYIIIGFVPVLLVALFSLVGGIVLYDNAAAYLFHQGLDDIVDEVHQVADTAAIEIGRNPATAASVIENRYRNRASRYPLLSLAVVPVGSPAKTGNVVTAGPWQHTTPPTSVPAWVAKARSFAGPLVVAERAGADVVETQLLVRSAAFTADGRYVVIVDLPCGSDVAAHIEERTGTRMGRMSVISSPQRDEPPPELLAALAHLEPIAEQPPGGMPFQRSVAYIEFTQWPTGRPWQVTVSLDAPLRRLYVRMAVVQSAQLASNLNSGLVILLVVLGVLFAIVQGSALFVGAALARQITNAIHELFGGTERVRQGDFAYRIPVISEDQLGDLADSFNRMSGSIEHLLHVQREKQRLDDELRIAREIQKSLLPMQPPRMAGLSIADLCEPAREVGGDYYDFFELGPRQLGVLVADVSGKGTSAALYMAELKGLMLALSHTEPSPRRLLVTVNHLLAEHLDNRSFITAMYAVIDLEAMTLTCARAGHTPLIVVSGGRSDIVVPDGMVLGLRLPGAEARFESILEEHTRPLAPGDLIVLYTDGITEAMDVDGELFGDAALSRVLCGPPGLSAFAVRERVLRDLRAFVGDAEPHDDMTMVILKVHAPGDGAQG
jgi:serine phosphatase RsbU (regulator of sigma subunit)